MEDDKNREGNDINPQNEEKHPKNLKGKGKKSITLTETVSKEKKESEDNKNKSKEFLPDISLINQIEKKNDLDFSFMDEDIFGLTNELKEISQKAI